MREKYEYLTFFFIGFDVTFSEPKYLEMEWNINKFSKIRNTSVFFFSELAVNLTSITVTRHIRKI